MPQNWRSHTLKYSWDGRTLSPINLSREDGGMDQWGSHLYFVHIPSSFYLLTILLRNILHICIGFPDSRSIFYPLSNLALNNILGNLKLSMSSLNQRKTWKVVYLWPRLALPLDYRLQWAMPTYGNGALQLCQWLALDPWVNGVETLCLRFLICEMGTSMMLSHRDKPAKGKRSQQVSALKDSIWHTVCSTPPLLSLARPTLEPDPSVLQCNDGCSCCPTPVFSVTWRCQFQPLPSREEQLRP